MLKKNPTYLINDLKDDVDYQLFLKYHSDISDNIHPVCTAYLAAHDAYMAISENKVLPDTDTKAKDIFNQKESYVALSQDIRNYENSNNITTKITPEQTMDVLKIAYSHFKDKEDAHDFMHMYKELFNIGQDQNNLINSKPTSDTLIPKLSRLTPRFGCAKHDLTPPHIYAISWPKKVIAAWLKLEHHPQVKEKPNGTDPVYLRSLTKSLMHRYVEGLTLLSPKLQQLSLLYFLAMNTDQKIIDAGNSYRSDMSLDAAKYAKSIPLFILMDIMTRMSNTTNLKHLQLLESIQSLQTNPATYFLKYMSSATDEQKDKLTTEYELKQQSSRITMISDTYKSMSPALN